MNKMFTLSPTDKVFLLLWGYLEFDFKQIEEATNVAVFTTNTGREVSWIVAKRILGNKEFLSGISRAAFHCTATRENSSNKHRVSIDCSNYFNS